MVRAGCLLALPRGERSAERKRRRGTTLHCGINEDNISTETGLLLIDAGCRNTERGRRVGKGRGFICVCLCMSSWGIGIDCMCMLSHLACVSLYDVSEGGVNADVLPLP